MSNHLPRIIIGVVAGFAMFFLASMVDGPDLLSVLIGVTGSIAVAGILISLSGNRKLATAVGAEKEAALTLAPAPGQALLVVTRQGLVGKLVGLNLSLDGRLFTQLKSPAFTIVEVAPGAHTLTTGFGGPETRDKAGAYAFEAAAGAVVAVVVTVSVGAVRFAPETDLEALRRKLRGMPMVLPEGAARAASPTAASA